MIETRFPVNYLPGQPVAQKLPALHNRIAYLRKHLIPQKLFFPCQIRMLVVTDSSGTFDDIAPFGLKPFLKAFEFDEDNSPTDNPAPYVNFTVKTAHRGNVSADFSNFNFSTHDLKQYDQIWLFGVGVFSTPLSPQELKAIATFMNEGGGIFATGDHEDLGLSLCGHLPRVRCMRRWWFSTADPLGSPAAPPAFDGNHNTITDNPAVPGTSLDQSDNYPQIIYPRYRRVWSGPFLRQRVFPHPVLCGPHGVIKVLPDHMHEGKCDVYNDFGRTLTFDGYSFPEFPNKSGAVAKEIPKVIADNINQITSQKFESITVYDGHLTDTNGRILCDATWHHFFNINLLGFEASRARVRAGAGSADDVRSEKDYENIRAYFRNIAYWISRRNDQACMRNKGYHIVLHDFDFKIAYKPLELVKDKIAYFIYWGELAKNSLNQFAPQCQWYEWLYFVVRDTYLRVRFEPLEDPIEKMPDLDRWFELEKIYSAIAGKAFYNLYEYIFQQKEFTEQQYKKFDEVALKGRDELINEMHKEMTKELAALKENLKIQ